MIKYTQNIVPIAEQTSETRALSGYRYLPRKPYPIPAYQGMAPLHGLIFAGYGNAVENMLPTDNLKRFTTTPKILSSRRNLNNPVFPTASGSFVGQAPTKGVYTGTHDDGCY